MAGYGACLGRSSIFGDGGHQGARASANVHFIKATRGSCDKKARSRSIGGGGWKKRHRECEKHCNTGGPTGVLIHFPHCSNSTSKLIPKQSPMVATKAQARAKIQGQASAKFRPRDPNHERPRSLAQNLRWVENDKLEPQPGKGNDKGGSVLPVPGDSQRLVDGQDVKSKDTKWKHRRKARREGVLGDRSLALAALAPNHRFPYSSYANAIGVLRLCGRVFALLSIGKV
ncbi:hypothetical protein QBC32DRAFT_328508 [Pseudoneurospora amorphoporcata]|uniref:Uncharacterized protein n=1 Tax=Pseudoneurospora amorphoporcata TaxID=241081 RepID=A0AAN6SBH0_9PEZI|nr:hypothetical protein QBC32DRAFT_328508 [Pseudoneurospora amorphoporcata]